jgi:hypothetical protein
MEAAFSFCLMHDGCLLIFGISQRLLSHLCHMMEAAFSSMAYDDLHAHLFHMTETTFSPLKYNGGCLLVRDRTKLKNKHTILHLIMWFSFNLRKTKEQE